MKFLDKHIFRRCMSLTLAGAMVLSLSACDVSSSDGTDGDAAAEMTSAELVADMGAGWNLGDTLDVCVADRDGDGIVNEEPAEGEAVDETLWGNVETTSALFEHLKADGIQSIRIPVTWRDHLDENNQVDEDWMNRVQEVVNYAYDLGLYVILNVHHDGGGDPDFGAWIRTGEAGFSEVEEKYITLWEQIAETFQDYDEHLVFESMNEVGFEDYTDLDTAYTMLNTLNQDFVDLVRESGGNNATRHLLIAGYWTDITMTCDARFVMPEDPAEHLILSVHYYTPYQFCITGENSTWGSDSEISQMTSLIEKLNDTFVSKGVPVIVGEYGMVSSDAESRILFSQTLTELCTAYGIAAFFWDNGSEYDRENLCWRTEGLVEAIVAGS